MSLVSLSAGQSGDAGFTRPSAQDVKWIRPEGPTYLPPAMPKSQAAERSERANALIVIALTLACTGLAIFDLFLLASGT